MIAANSPRNIRFTTVHRSFVDLGPWLAIVAHVVILGESWVWAAIPEQTRALVGIGTMHGVVSSQ